MLKGLAAVAAAAMLGYTGMALAAPATTAPASDAPMKIGIIGARQIGGTLAKLWVAAGHEVLISSRHPEELRPLAQSLGPKAKVGTPREAALFGDVVLVGGLSRAREFDVGTPVYTRLIDRAAAAQSARNQVTAKVSPVLVCWF